MKERLYTIAEAAQATGLTKKAMRSRVDRAQADTANPDRLQVVTIDGERRIAGGELVRVGLLTPDGQPTAAPAVSSDDLDLAIAVAEARESQARETLVDQARYLSRRMGSLAERVASGGNVNPLGEDQGQGARLDVYCAQLRAAEENLASLRALRDGEAR